MESAVRTILHASSKRKLHQTTGTLVAKRALRLPFHHSLLSGAIKAQLSQRRPAVMATAASVPASAQPAMKRFTNAATESKIDTSKYFLGENPSEVERLSYQHAVIKDHMKGQLVLAPIDLSVPGLQMLDSATADGLWLRDLHASISSSSSSSSSSNQNHYTGTDINPSYFPSAVPANTTFRVQSIAAPYPTELHSHFDLVHQRLALPGCGTYPLQDAVASLCTLVKPGGWIQLMEADHSGPMADFVAIRDAFKLIKELFAAMGVRDDYAQNLGKWLREAGMVDVGGVVLDVRLGAMNEKSDMAAMGAESYRLATAGLVKAARSIPNSFKKEQLDEMAAHVGKSLTEVGAIHQLHVAWGRRPMSAAFETTS